MELSKRSNSFSLVILLILSYGAESALSSKQDVTPPELTITQGTVQGLKFVTRHNRSVSGFLGIPFAKPPIGNLRFESPVAADAWNGTLYATSDQKVCPQLSANEVIGDEDCLYLNVYTPQIPTDKGTELLAVMMYIHGGGFEKGSGSSSHYSPEYLLDKDVVLVAPNYRLGALGFLSTGDEVAPGNYGVKDLVLALQWVKNNVEHFGGNADQVTIFGQGSGAGAVELLSLSNSTIGLFHRYITGSGSALSIRSFRPRRAYISRAAELGRYLGCPIISSTQLVDCLKKLNASQIVSTKSLFYRWKNFPDLVWGPTDEPNVNGAFITETPTKLYATGQVRDLPWIAGVVRDEGLILSLQFYVNPELFNEFLERFDEVLPHVLQYHNIFKDQEGFTKALKDYYFNDLNADREVLLSNLTKLIGDSMMRYPIYSGLEQRLIFVNSVEYLYSFEYRGTCSFSYKYSGGSMKNYGVASADDLLYLFPHPDPIIEALCEEKSKTDYQMVDTMVQLWTSFAIDGEPSAQDLEGTKWTPHASGNNYLLIGNNEDVDLEIHYFYLANRMQFWKTLNGTESDGEETIGSKITSFLGSFWSIGARILRSVMDVLFFWV